MTKRRLYLTVLALITVLCLTLSGCSFLFSDNGDVESPITEVPQNVVIAGEKIPAYTNEGYYAVNGNKPFFADSEITDKGFYEYTNLDSLGRAGMAYGCIGPETLPTDEREDIGHITPSGWEYNGKSNNNKYDKSTGVNSYIYNRAHLLANQLVSNDVDERNFITGTCAMNQKHMVKFENMVADYVKETDCHVMYRVTPYFEGQNLICSGVLMEGLSVEDNGESVEFCVFVYNVQPGIYINYLTGENCLADEAPDVPDVLPCDHTNTEIRDALTAGCASDGYTGDTYCKACGEKISGGDVISATGEHTYGEWAENADGTLEVRQCTACDAKEERAVEPDEPDTPNKDPDNNDTPTPDGDTSVKVPENLTIGTEKIPSYTTSPYVTVNGGSPFFTSTEIVNVGYYTYSELDSLGRAGMAIGCIGPETLPTDAREDIGHIHPSGWYLNGISNNNSYPASTGVNGTIYNRSHLLANQLVDEDVDPRNFVTGTSAMNQKHMVKFENMVADYVKETGGHVMYRVTPYFEGENLICSGVLMEGISVEDNGESVKFCVFVYNVQPGIYINYLTGENCIMGEEDGSNDTPDGEYTVADAPSAGTAYKLMGQYNAGIRYFNGTISKGMQTTDDITKAVDVYLESTGVDGQYYLYYYENGTKTYIVMGGNTTTSMKKSATPSTYWTFNSSNGAFVSSYESGNSLGHRGLSTDPTREDIRAYYDGETGSKYLPIQFVTAN